MLPLLSARMVLDRLPIAQKLHPMATELDGRCFLFGLAMVDAASAVGELMKLTKRVFEFEAQAMLVILDDKFRPRGLTDGACRARFTTRPDWEGAGRALV